MFEHAERMLIDVGNSFVHWQCGGASGQFSSRDLPLVPSADFLAALLNCRYALLVSVASPAVATAIKAMALDIVWHQAQSFPLGVLSSEYDTTALGRDRWVGLLGVLSEVGSAQSVLLVDAGTAVNIELLEGRHHRGGWIMPGYRTWFDSLLSNTQMRMARPDQPELQCGKQTADAVANAWLESVVGIVERYRNRIPNLVIVLTGGDAPRLAGEIKNVAWVPDLMFKGLEFWFEHVESKTACGG